MLLLLVITFGWMVRVLHPEATGITLSVDKAVLSMKRSVDLNADGVPDVDSSGSLILQPVSGNNVLVTAMAPGTTVVFELDVGTASYAGTLSLRFVGVSFPDGQPQQVAQAMHLQYTDPVSNETVDEPLSAVLDTDGNAVVLSGVPVAAKSHFTFQYRMTLAQDAGNDVQACSVRIGTVYAAFSRN